VASDNNEKLIDIHADQVAVSHPSKPYLNSATSFVNRRKIKKNPTSAILFLKCVLEIFHTKMSLYPSLEDMKVDQMAQSQSAVFAQAAASGAASSAGYPQPYSSGYPQPTTAYPPLAAMPTAPTASVTGYPADATVYPELNSYMGLEFDEQTIRANMPEYLVAPVQNTQIQPTSGSGGSLVAPISSQSPAFQRSQINHAVRTVILCKDRDGKVGLRVKSIDKGVFVALVTKGSPAALGGLRFGDQILQINGENIAGFDEQKVNKIFKKAGVNNICLAVRDRPFERTLTLHKDSTGHIGFQFKEGEIKAIAVGTSAARNGLLINHHLVEVNGQNVVGLKDQSIQEIIESGGGVITITVIPSMLYKHMIKNMSQSIVKKMMDHSIPDM